MGSKAEAAHRAAQTGESPGGRFPLDVVDMLRGASAFRALAPRVFGGGQVDPVTFLRVTEEASYADGSVGWCL